jgi:plastocyanin
MVGAVKGDRAMTRHRLSSLGWLLALLAATFGVGVGVSAGPASAVPDPPIQVSVDHAGPGGHNYEFKDYFPRGDAASPLNVVAGSTVQFNWPSTPDGFHTATLLASTTDPGTVWDSFPIAVPDPDDSAAQLQFNPAIAAPTNPPAGSPAPGACGDVATPCVYDGTADLNSGAQVSNGTNSFVVQISRKVSVGTKVPYACLIHRGMAAQLTVVAPGSGTTQVQADTESAAQYAADLPEAQSAEAAANVPAVTSNADGTNTITMSAGTETAHTAVLEFLPMQLAAKTGDKVVWKMTDAMAEIHTITFPKGTESNEPLPQFCEADPAADTPFDPATAPPGPPCGDPSLFEVHVSPGPAGGTSIATASTEATSGLLFPPGGPLPSSYGFTFPATGSFPYFCHIHSHGMVGAVSVSAPAVAAQPVASPPAFTG